MNVCALSLLLLTTGLAGAAAPSREEFSSGLNGWTNTAAPAWRGTNGYAQVTFSALPAPQLGTLLATGALASASFMGDYVAQDIGLIGFRFQAASVLPSTLTLRWMRGTNGYFRNLQGMIQSTGTWYTIYCSLADKDTGAWSGDDAELFSTVLGAVDSVALSVLTPALLAPAIFRVDDIHIARLPRGATLRTEAGPHTHWQHLFSNSLYRLEQSTAPDQPWTLSNVVLATNETITLAATGSVEAAVWRLVLP
jgi:hypothetical protein